MKHIQNNQKSKGKSVPAYGFSKTQEKNPETKSLKACQMFVFPKRKPYPRPRV
jgi:hypothetical protein